jgi:hypothetical protein
LRPRSIAPPTGPFTQTGTDPGGAPGHYSVETVPGDKLCQKDLYEAMVAARRAGIKPGP